jgi:colicin import membrane protein
MPPGKDGDAAALPRPKANTDEANQDGVLPPPPDRLPRRAVPTVPVKPVDRSAAVPPKPEPLPKPRPDAKIESMPLPSPSPAEAKRQPASLPMPPGKDGDPAALSRPKANTDESNRDGLLPPPPERLPRRAVPADPVKPVDRTVAVPPKPEALPKPRPDAKIESMPLASPPPPVVSARRPVSAPMLLTPPSVSNAAPQLRGGTTQPNKSGNASAPSATNVIMADPDPDDILPAPENASGNALHILH